ncbi:MAG TPA: outer membrane protein assembly factor BamA [Treponemataceae bacterium]|nr:outer membrane protein assembly factor BamA [Treponemataceae bacterium]HPS44510.1 outer membrane protein assembly factor BamA [Treponemataceae bacterium]
MRTKLIALLTLIACLAGAAFAETTEPPKTTSESWYQDKPIRSITFDGLKSVSRNELNGLFSSYQGKNFNDAIYWEILQKLYALEYFADITPVAVPGDEAKTSVILNFKVVEKPVIKSIKFSGNKKLKAAEILEKVTLKEGDIFNELKSRSDERAIRDFYLEKGYANVKVSSEATTGKDGSIVLIFTINEGKQTIVSALRFEGNKVMASRTLKKELKLKENKLFSTGTFREADLEADKLSIESYYHERGYIDAKVESVIRDVDTEKDKNKNLLTLTFVIKEGEQYTYGGTKISGNHLFTNEELLSKIRLTEGDVLNLNRFNEGYQAIADVYFENGYTSNYITKKENRDADRKVVSYEVFVVEHGRSHVENIVIRGNKKTKERVITREFLLEPGDIFSKKKLIESIRNLYNLRYFSTVAPDVVQGSEENLIDVIVNVEEQSTASIQFGVTFSGTTDADTFPLSVFVQWEDKNFLGNGQTVSANATVSPDTQSLSLGYSENYFMSSPLTVSFSLSVAHKTLYAYQDSQFPVFDDGYYDDYGMVPDPFTSYDDYDDASSLDTSYRMKYQQWSYSLGVSTGYRWFPSFAMTTLRGGVTFSVVQNFYDDTIFRPADKNIRDKHGEWGWANSVWTRLSFDRRDVNYDPSSGWFLSQQVTYHGLFPSIETEFFTRFDTKGEFYVKLLELPLSDTYNLKIVLAGNSGFSFQVPTRDVPISDTNKLYIDGMFTGRGWTSLYDDNIARGDLMLNHALELRAPVVPNTFALDFFFDAVAVKKDIHALSDLSLNDYYFSYGPGLRFLIPQFPLRLMFANCFRIQDGKVEWKNDNRSNWNFVLSFNMANL